MEAVVYDVRGTTARQRGEQLRRAWDAFAVTAQTRRDVRAFALLVPLPSPSPQQQQPRKRQRDASSSAAVSVASTVARNARSNHADAALCECARTVAQRLRRARRDARLLSRYVNGTPRRTQRAQAATTRTQKQQQREKTAMRPAAGRAVAVLVVAVLQPTSCDALAVYTAWQSDHDATTRSPLRYAHALLVTCATRELLLQWCALPPAQRAALSLGALLLPHQSMLVDVTWCVVPNSTLATTTPKRRQQQDDDDDDDVYMRTFVRELLPTLRARKGRCALWLSYAQLLPCCYAENNNNNNGNNSPAALSFVALHSRLRALYALLYAARGAAGQNTHWRLCCGYGGSAAALAVRAAATSSSSLPSLHSRLHTRALRDVYALLSVLTGDDRADLYTAACAFCRGMLHRCDTAAALTTMLCRRGDTSDGRGAPHVRVVARHKATSRKPSTTTTATAMAAAVATTTSVSSCSRKRARSPSDAAADATAATTTAATALTPLSWHVSV